MRHTFSTSEPVRRCLTNVSTTLVDGLSSDLFCFESASLQVTSRAVPHWLSITITCVAKPMTVFSVTVYEVMKSFQSLIDF